jgi:hypothetical protein
MDWEQQGERVKCAIIRATINLMRLAYEGLLAFSLNSLHGNQSCQFFSLSLSLFMHADMRKTRMFLRSLLF